MKVQQLDECVRNECDRGRTERFISRWPTLREQIKVCHPHSTQNTNQSPTPGKSDVLDAQRGRPRFHGKGPVVSEAMQEQSVWTGIHVDEAGRGCFGEYRTTSLTHLLELATEWRIRALRLAACG